jgi:spermidine/putrescine transport system permease protein
MMLCVLLPAGVTLVTSLWKAVYYDVEPIWNLENYRTVLTDPLYNETLIHTIVVAGIVGLLAAALSIPLAWTIVFKMRRHRLLALGVVVMSLWIGYLLRIYGWRLFFGSEGVVNGALEGLGLIDEPIRPLLFTDFTVVVGLVHLALPFAFIPIYLAFERLPRELLEAGSDLGANRRRAAMFVVLPIVGNSIVAGITFGFIISFGDYFAPPFLGAPGSSLIGNIAQAQFGSALNRPLGSAIGVVMVVVIALVLILPQLAVRQAGKLARRRRERERDAALRDIELAAGQAPSGRALA